MSFSIKCRWHKLFFLLSLALSLFACGAKQADSPKLELVENIKIDAAGEDLNHGEIKALQDTGQIDKNVPEHAMPEIKAQYKYFLRKGRNSMCAFSRRSEQYLAYAKKVFRERGMPEELAYLAIVESGYRPNAVSRVGAAGAWQFMPQTGTRYGLAQDWWQDERLDPYRATEAAADYLQTLYGHFGDWPTAIAAYNAGEGKMMRAKQGTGAKDFYEVTALNDRLDEKAQLREETKQYVPRFIAVTKIMRNLPKLGFDPIEPDKAEKITRIKAKPGTDLRELSRAVNIDWMRFQEMNQHHKRVITCTDKETFVYVPSRVKELAKTYFCTPTQNNFSGWRPVKVASSKDTLEKISKRANIPLAKLQAANPGAGKLVAGQIILAPYAVGVPPKAETALKTEQKKGRHVFGPRDTLYSVARRYNTSVEALKAHNSILDESKIRVGSIVTIPGMAKIDEKRTKTPGKHVYTVQNKDSLWSIAKRHNISVADLRKWNKLADNGLKPGATLVIAQD